MAQLAAVVFDFDGVILDSESAEFESHRLIYERHGVALTPDDWCDQIGVWAEEHEQRWCTRLNELCGAAMEYSAFKAEQHRLFRELLAPEPMRGIRELLDALALAEIPTAVASTTPARGGGSAVERPGSEGRFAPTCSAHRGAAPKP